MADLATNLCFRRPEEDIQRHCVWIVEGFQTDENLSLKDGMTIN
ncbi:MAG: hypothetical protein ACLR1V_05780 [Coprococcus sp.]